MIILSLTILIKCSSLLGVGKAHEAVTSLFLGPFYFVCLQATSSVCRRKLYSAES